MGKNLKQGLKSSDLIGNHSFAGKRMSVPKCGNIHGNIHNKSFTHTIGEESCYSGEGCKFVSFTL